MIRIDGAKVREENKRQWLCLRLEDDPANILEANRRVIETTGTRDVEIKQHREKRSLDANGYCWLLIDKLSERVGKPKEDVYRDEIRHLGGISDVVCVKVTAVDKLCENWSKRGIGWLTDVQDSKLPGCKNVTLTYGSSTFDTKQMDAFIEQICEDCRAVGIETATPEEIARMGNA